MIEFVLNGLPPSFNDLYSGGHWSKRTKMKQAVTLWMWSEIQEKLRNVEIPKKFSLIVIQQSKGTPRDCDNCVVASKFFLDFLVKKELIKDDSPKYVPEVVLRSRKGPTNQTIFQLIPV